MVSGSFGIQVVRATPADLPFIDRLRQRDSRALGFLSRQALAEKIRLGFVLLARATSGTSRDRFARGPSTEDSRVPFAESGAGAPRSEFQVHSAGQVSAPTANRPRVQLPDNTDVTPALGFVLHGSLRGPEVRLFQIAVDPDFRGLGVARQLMSALLRRCRRIGTAGLSLRCREELHANRFWHHLGFVLHDLEPGRRGTLFVWVKSLLRNRATNFHSRWHPCPGCQRMTCGSWTAGGVRQGKCDRCAEG